MRDKIIILTKRYFSTPIIHDKFRIYKEFKKGKEGSKEKIEKKKIIYSKPSYEHMYSGLPLKPFVN